jgi:purine-binding chemotaxis protein CheW
MQIVVFRTENQRQGVLLESVQRVIAAVELVPLPGSPAILLGLMDMAGQVLPVFGMRERLGLPRRPLCAADQFLLVRTGWRELALVVDETEGIVRCDPVPLPAQACASLQGWARVEDGDGASVVLIHDLERFLSEPERGQVEACLDRSN